MFFIFFIFLKEHLKRKQPILIAIPAFTADDPDSDLLTIESNENVSNVQSSSTSSNIQNQSLTITEPYIPPAKRSRQLKLFGSTTKMN